MQDTSPTTNEFKSSRFVPEATDSDSNVTTQPKMAFTIQNFVLVWLDSKIVDSDNDIRNSTVKLRQIVNRIDLFTDADKCVDFMSKIEKEKIFIIVSGSLGQLKVPDIHNMTQIDSIYVFCQDQSKYARWAEEWSKIKGVFTQIDDICDALKRDTKQCDHDSTTISVTSKDLNRLEPSFMYTQLLKDTLIDIAYEEEENKQLAIFCRQHYSENPEELKIIDEFENEYRVHTPLWWYSRECFTYKMLNRALRTQEVQIILNMGFFIRDVHQHIVDIHAKTKYEAAFYVYRGHGVLFDEFSKLQQSKGGLLAFNNFLSTSSEEKVAWEFLRKSIRNPQKMGVLFRMLVDPSTSSVPFASLKGVSAFDAEAEILFSMHTVFHVVDVTELEDRIWQVDLALTSEDDPELKKVSEHIRTEAKEVTGWERLGYILIRMANYREAEGAFQIVRKVVSDDDEIKIAKYYHRLGFIRNAQADYNAALHYYDDSLAIRLKALPPKHKDLAKSYVGIGEVHRNMGDFSKAIEFHIKALDMRQEILPPDDPFLADSYDKTAITYGESGEYSKALEFFQKGLEIRQKILPANHPDLASSFNNVAAIYQNTGQYSEALAFYQKTLEIDQRSLAPTHPDIAICFDNIALVHELTGDYSTALEFQEKALKIRKKALPPNHPGLALSYNNIAVIYDCMGDYPKALEFNQNALDIRQKYLTPNHLDLARSYNSIGLVHEHMEEFPKALDLCEKALEIFQKSLPPNHPELAFSYYNTAEVYDKMGNYSKALELYQTSLEIRQKCLPPDHIDLGKSYFNIAFMHEQMKEYSNALDFYEKSLTIAEKSLPPDDPSLAFAYYSIARIYNLMGEYSKELECHQKALDIRQKSLPPNHPDLADSYSFMALTHKNMKEDSKALEFYNKALEINKNSDQPNPISLADINNNIGEIYKNREEYSTALPFFERALQIGHEANLPEDDPNLKLYEKNLAEARSETMWF